MKRTMIQLALACALAAAGGSGARAADLVMGSSTEPSAIDPQYSRTGANQNVAAQIFERLVRPDENLQLQPALAQSWTNLDPTTWRISLRPNVRFHDGSPLTADDVVYSLNRVRTIANSPAPFTDLVGSIATATALDPLTLEVKTKTPTPDLMDQIGLVFILRKATSEARTLEAFSKGDAAIGTGPYRYRGWQPGDRILLERNDDYWGPKPDFEKVVIRFIPNGAARIAALRSGEVDLIDAVPPADVKALAANRHLRLFSTASARIVYLALDSSRDASPFVTGIDGKRLTTNPLKDARVRQALSLMVNRTSIVQRMLDGAGEPAAQMVPQGVGGHDPNLHADYDPRRARALLAEAGYPQGFGLTIHTSSDRFAGDAQVGQALGQMFAQGGIKVNGVVAQPYNVYAAAASRQAFSAFVFTYGTTTPTAAIGLKAVLMSFDAEAGTGSLNRARYANPVFDAKMREAMSTFDRKTREALLADAMGIAVRDTAIIPLYWPVISWAAKANVTYIANRGEEFQAQLAAVAK